jgi:hypothetical protein
MCHSERSEEPVPKPPEATNFQSPGLTFIPRLCALRALCGKIILVVSLGVLGVFGVLAVLIVLKEL